MTTKRIDPFEPALMGGVLISAGTKCDLVIAMDFGKGNVLLTIMIFPSSHFFVMIYEFAIGSSLGR
jgi:hypothetical protein